MVTDSSRSDASVADGTPALHSGHLARHRSSLSFEARPSRALEGQDVMVTDAGRSDASVADGTPALRQPSST